MPSRQRTPVARTVRKARASSRTPFGCRRTTPGPLAGLCRISWRSSVRPYILFTRLAVRLAMGLTLVLAACSNEPTDVSTPDRPTGPLLAIGTDPVSGARIETNQDDYAPGEVVHLTGFGWAANETIALFMREEPNTHEDVTSQVVADSTGAFSMHFYDVQQHDLGVTFTLTATGLTSGSEATAVFTDGVTSVTGVEFSPAAPAPGGVFDVEITVSITSPGGVKPWKGTEWSIDGGAVTCVNTGDHTTTGSGFEETLTGLVAPASSGPHTLTLRLFQDDLCSNTQSAGGNTGFPFTVGASNTAPILGAVGNQSVVEGVALSFTATATDDGLPAPPELTFTLETPGAACLLLHPQVPAGATITEAGAFSWTPTESEGPQTYCARIKVSDGALDDFEDFEISVTEGNAAPVLTAIGPQSVNELAQLSFAAAADDDDLPANTLTFTLGTPAAACGHPIADGAAITGTGAFTWTPTELQGPGTFCARVVVSDGTDDDFEDIVITVAEVNVAPVLTVPASFSTEWGVALSGVQASASDADLPANTLTFSLVSPPSGMTIDPSSGVISWTPGSGTVGANVITVKVTDNGTPPLDDQTPTFTITVTVRPTKLIYTGNFAGQYSDQDSLKATLTDDGAGALNGTALSGKLVRVVFGGSNVGADLTDLSGEAGFLYQILTPAGTYVVTANFNGDAAYAGSSDTDNDFVVAAEHADVIPDVNNSSAFQVPSPGAATGAVTLKFDVKEDVTPAPEPDVNDGALAGNINNAGFTVSLIPVAGGGNVALTCTAPAAAAGYTTRTFTCANAAVPLGAYEVAAVIGTGGTPNGSYYVGRYDDALTVYDPSLGFVTGGGKFIIDATGDRVSFGLVVNYTGKGKTTARGNLVVVRHHADGSTCRAKSNAIDAPAIIGATATFTGKANYACVDALGVLLPGGAGNLTLTGYVEDNGEPGASAAASPDKFWVKVYGELMMTTSANSTNAKPLTGGNIQVPKIK